MKQIQIIITQCKAAAGWELDIRASEVGSGNFIPGVGLEGISFDEAISRALDHVAILRILNVQYALRILDLGKGENHEVP